MPAASAVRTARAVGAETATSVGMPAIGRLLHHLDRDPAGEEQQAIAAGDAAPRHRADQLVERVVPADILADEHDALAAAPERGGMDGVGLAIERLERRQRLHGGHDLVGREDADPPPTVATGRIASARLSMPQRPQPVGPAMWRRRSRKRGGPGLARATSGARSRRPRATTCEVADLGGRGDDALGQGEADGEVLEISRRRHHHGVGAAVIGEGDRHLLGDSALAGALPVAAISEAPDAATALVIALLRRLDRGCDPAGLACARASYSSCHALGPLDGETCTAVTLYSGQLVAQSE